MVIQREVLRRAIRVAAGKLKDVDREHIEMIRGLLDKNVGRRCHLPHQLQAVRTYEGISIKREMAGEARSSPGICIDVRAPGNYTLPGPGIIVELSMKKYPAKNGNKYFYWPMAVIFYGLWGIGSVITIK